MSLQITFRKTGREIKAAIAQRQQQLQSRLDRRNAALATFMEDPAKVRSYLIRSTHQQYRGHGGGGGYVLFAPDDISSEEKQEVGQLCSRIFEIEQELHRLALIVAHLNDEQTLELSLDDLIGYGFNAEGVEGESA